MAANRTSSNLPIPPIFTGENYDYWAIRMKAFFVANGLWDLVQEDFEEREDLEELSVNQMKAYNEKAQKHNIAISYLFSLVSEEIFPLIVGAKTAKEAWEILQKQFQGSARTRQIRLQTLRREFEMLKMKETESIKDYASKVQGIVNQMKLHGEQVPDTKVVEKILITVSDKFDAKVAAIEESKDISELIVTEVVGSLQAYEQRLLKRYENSVEEAFQARQLKILSGRNTNKQMMEKKGGAELNSFKGAGKSVKFPPCGICQKTTHDQRWCWKNKECNFCGKMGHIERVCRAKQSQGNQQQFEQNNRQQHQAKVADVDDDEELLFMVQHLENFCKEEEWFIDSGCTCHMTKDRRLFCDLDESVKAPVKMANGAVMNSEGRGTISVRTNSGIGWNRVHDQLEGSSCLLLEPAIMKSESSAFLDQYLLL